MWTKSKLNEVLDSITFSNPNNETVTIVLTLEDTLFRVTVTDFKEGKAVRDYGSTNSRINFREAVNDFVEFQKNQLEKGFAPVSD